MRHRTGLRNRFRSGRSSYSVKDKRRRADTYGSFERGHRTRAEVIAGTTLTYEPGENRR